jgi:hypothetical protein
LLNQFLKLYEKYDSKIRKIKWLMYLIKTI